jgi:hypothetical protein
MMRRPECSSSATASRAAASVVSRLAKWRIPSTSRRCCSSKSFAAAPWLAIALPSNTNRACWRRVRPLSTATATATTAFALFALAESSDRTDDTVGLVPSKTRVVSPIASMIDEK